MKQYGHASAALPQLLNMKYGRSFPEKSPPKSIHNYSLSITITYYYDKIKINNFIL